MSEAWIIIWSDLHAVLARVQQGVEVVIEQDDRPEAVLKVPPMAFENNREGARGPGRKLSECITLAKAYEENLGYPSPMPISLRTYSRELTSGAIPSNRPHGISPRFQRADRRGA